MNNPKYNAIFLAVILIVTFLAFWPSLSNDFIAWDDPGYLIENSLVHELSVDNIKTIFTTFTSEAYHYQPLTILSYAIEYHFAGLNPEIYHATNLALHLLNTVLVFVFIYLLCGQSITALVTALFFGIHPLNVESVAWVTARKNVLFLFFYLNAAIMYIKHCQTNQKNSRFFILTILFFVLSLLSKPAAVTFPIILLLIDYYRQRKFESSLWIEKIPLFLLSVVLGILILYDSRIPFENLYPAIQSFNFGERILLVSYAFWEYLYKLVWPLNLSCFYPFPEKITGGFYFYLLFLMGLIAAIFFSLKKNKVIIFGFTFFLVAISLNLPISTVSFTATADRFTYLPFIGLFFVIGETIRVVYQGTGKLGEYRRLIVWICLVGVVLFCFAQTWNRCRVWKNNGVLWRDVASKYPKVPLAHYFIGNDFYKKGQIEQAISSYSRAIELMPHYFTAYNNRGAMYFYQQDMDSAIDDYNRALHYNPNYISAYLNRAYYFVKLGEWGQAVVNFENVLEIDPSHTAARQGKKIAVERLQGNE